MFVYLCVSRENIYIYILSLVICLSICLNTLYVEDQEDHLFFREKTCGVTCSEGGRRKEAVFRWSRRISGQATACNGPELQSYIWEIWCKVENRSDISDRYWLFWLDRGGMACECHCSFANCGSLSSSVSPSPPQRKAHCFGLWIGEEFSMQ